MLKCKEQNFFQILLLISASLDLSNGQIQHPGFTIPPGLFTTAGTTTTTTTATTNTVAQTPPPQLPLYESYDDIDNYVPYRSDVHDHFSWALLKEIILNNDEQEKNVIISPFSVKLLLAMLSEAAGNNTQTQRELLSTLTDIRSSENLRNFYKKNLIALKRENPYHTFNLETRLYTDLFIEPQQRFKAILHDNFFTDIQRLEFSNPKSAAFEINNWAENVTHGRLLNIVNEDSLQNTVMLMANVIYFNGIWRRQFNETFDGVFLRSPTEQKQVTYIEQTEYFYYYDSNKLDAKILRLPYKGKQFSMFIILPKTKWGIDELARSLQNEQLKNMQWMMEELEVKVTLPKFKFKFNKSLKETLKIMGINDIFTDRASLPGLARGVDVAGKLKVTNILQKAGIDVNEKGTEAFASTVVHLGNKFGGSSTAEFNVNRPFLFFIEEEATGNILFAGKVTDPFYNTN